MASKFLIEIDDDPRIAKVVGFVIRVTRKKNNPCKYKQTILDYDLAKSQPGTPVKWVLKLRRAANNPDIPGDNRVAANIVHLIIYDRFDKQIDSVIRRFPASATP